MYLSYPSKPVFQLFCLAVILTGVIMPASARETIAGPVDTKVIRILDGDTFLGEARIWPGQTVRVKVRIRGIDAPEKRARCEAERKAAARALQMLSALLQSGPVRIRNIGGGKYYGRVLADVSAGEIRSVAALLLSRAVVRPYRGGKRYTACR